MSTCLPPEFGFALAADAIDAGLLRESLADPRVGAILIFEGRVRNRHREHAVSGLDYEAYADLAVAEGVRILIEARQGFDLLDARCVHRIGQLAIGELAVWVGVSAGHRDAAFASCRYIIDEVKARVPIWKREHYVDHEPEWLHPLP